MRPSITLTRVLASNPAIVDDGYLSIAVSTWCHSVPATMARRGNAE